MDGFRPLRSPPRAVYPTGVYRGHSRMKPLQVGSSSKGGATASDEGSLDQYLREISRYPLISQDEEVTLACRIREGDEEALDKLVRSNLRFLVSVAKNYKHQGVSLSDLINEGNLGLI